jgi:hypothetical protein
VPVTPAERKQLLKLLNEVRFAQLVGTYTQKQLSDGFNETLTLTTTDYGKTNTYVVRNYGDRAPKDYYKVTEFLRGLRNRKLAPRSID